MIPSNEKKKRERIRQLIIFAILIATNHQTCNNIKMTVGKWLKLFNCKLWAQDSNDTH